MFNKTSVERIGKKELIKFLDHLEHQCGGHGNGMLLVKDGKITVYKKGLKLYNKDIAKMAIEEDYDWFMYHTRISSAGSIKDSNCHPFVNKTQTFALEMNGTERLFGKLGKAQDITDTEMIFKILNTFKIDLSALDEFTANYMGFRNKKMFVQNTHDLKYIDAEGAVIIASSFPFGSYKEKELEPGLWIEGTPLVQRKKFQYQYRGPYAWNQEDRTSSKSYTSPYRETTKAAEGTSKKGWEEIDVIYNGVEDETKGIPKDAPVLNESLAEYKRPSYIDDYLAAHKDEVKQTILDKNGKVVSIKL